MQLPKWKTGESMASSHFKCNSGWGGWMLWPQGYITLAQDPHHFSHESNHVRTHHSNKDPLNTKVAWILKLQTEHCCKTGTHAPSSIGCFYIGPNQWIPLWAGDLSEWAMGWVTTSTSNTSTPLVHSFRLWIRLEWAWLSLLPHWTWMYHQGLGGHQIPRQVLLGMI